VNHLEKKVMYLVWAWAILGSSTAFAKDIPSLGRDCQNGDQRACAEITRIVVATKRPKDRIAAIPFISDTSVLTSISNDSTQDRDVSRAAADRLSVLNKQARDRKEAEKAIMPNPQEIQRQVALLDSYKVGVTTLDDFYADKWNASDPYLSKLGIVEARYEIGTHTVELHIAYFGDYDRHAELDPTISASKVAQTLFEDGSKGARNGIAYQMGLPPWYDLHGIALTAIDSKYPGYHLLFEGGILASIKKE